MNQALKQFCKDIENQSLIIILYYFQNYELKCVKSLTLTNKIFFESNLRREHSEYKNDQFTKSKFTNIKNVKHFVEHFFAYVEGIMDIWS